LALTDNAPSSASGAPRTLAAVITFNPDASLRLHLEALSHQADAVLIVDNGSMNFRWIEDVAASCGCIIRRNALNEGIARALNQAAEYSLGHGYRWLVTFDQDSLAGEGLIPGLVDVYTQLSSHSQIAVVCANHIDRRTETHYHVPHHVMSESVDWRQVRVAITSGSLIPTAVFREVGFFDESLFIDYVDHEFCMRCRRHGMKIIESKRHVLIHSLGNSTKHRLLGRSVVCSNHSPSRRYYITRNQLEVYRRYVRFDFRWCVQGLVDLFAGSVLVLLFESEKMAKARAILSGAAHFVLRRFGRAPQSVA
jgi:rhamnosyltransferase